MVSSAYTRGSQSRNVRGHLFPEKARKSKLASRMSLPFLFKGPARELQPNPIDVLKSPCFLWAQSSSLCFAQWIRQELGPRLGIDVDFCQEGFEEGSTHATPCCRGCMARPSASAFRAACNWASSSWMGGYKPSRSRITVRARGARAPASRNRS